MTQSSDIAYVIAVMFIKQPLANSVVEHICYWLSTDRHKFKYRFGLVYSP